MPGRTRASDVAALARGIQRLYGARALAFELAPNERRRVVNGQVAVCLVKDLVIKTGKDDLLLLPAAESLEERRLRAAVHHAVRASAQQQQRSGDRMGAADHPLAGIVQ